MVESEEAWVSLLLQAYPLAGDVSLPGSLLMLVGREGW